VSRRSDQNRAPRIIIVDEAEWVQMDKTERAVVSGVKLACDLILPVYHSIEGRVTE